MTEHFNCDENCCKNIRPEFAGGCDLVDIVSFQINFLRIVCGVTVNICLIKKHLQSIFTQFSFLCFNFMSIFVFMYHLRLVGKIW